MWGPTCDGFDLVKRVMFPELQPGDWFYFNNMGAYTFTAASRFNGMPEPQFSYTMTEADW